MANKLKLYQKKRNFSKTTEPKGKVEKTRSKLRFSVQHHMASHDHFDFRLQWRGVLLSWAVPKGFSNDPNDKRLAIRVEDHPVSYARFEGTIPQGEYGGGTVMLWDEGVWEPAEKNVSKALKEGKLKFTLFGKRLKGNWTLIELKNNEKTPNGWLMIKDEEEQNQKTALNDYQTSIKTGRTMDEIAEGKRKNKTNVKKILSKLNPKTNAEPLQINGVKITNPNKFLFENVTKIDLIRYYIAVAERMMPFLEQRIISIFRCPDGTKEECFFKKHLVGQHKGLHAVTVTNKKGNKDEFYYIDDITGLIYEVQMNTIEFHIWGSKVDNLEHPNYMVFDLDPDVGLDLKNVRQGVRDLKKILDGLHIISFLKTTGGKGYHIVIPFAPTTNWETFYEFSKNIVRLMELTWPDRYTSNMRKVNRKNKIFVDAERNGRGSTAVAPYSVRARKKATVSMPIAWSELGKIKPDGIDMRKAVRRLKKPDPWKNFFKTKQELK